LAAELLTLGFNSMTLEFSWCGYSLFALTLLVGRQDRHLACKRSSSPKGSCFGDLRGTRLYVCVCVGRLTQKLQMNFDEFFWVGGMWDWQQLISLWWWSGSWCEYGNFL